MKITAIDTTPFRLDGGGMFGVVPKAVWSKRAEADDRNRVLMTTRVLLIETDDAQVLIDTGLGDGYDPQFFDRFAIDPAAASLTKRLEQIDINRGDITHVVQTHGLTALGTSHRILGLQGVVVALGTHAGVRLASLRDCHGGS